MNYDMLFSPMKIGNVEIKNRIVMAPMCMGFGQYNGCAHLFDDGTEQTLTISRIIDGELGSEPDKCCFGTKNP